LLERIEKGAESFRSSLKDALGDSRFDDTKSEDRINDFVKEFESATDRLEDRFDDDRSATGAVEEVLRRASSIDNFMLRHRLSPRAQSDWAGLRRNLDELAQAYNVAWSWAGLTNSPYRISDEQLKNLLGRIEKGADRFRDSLKDALSRSRLDDTRAEDNINQFVKDFEEATDRLEGRFDSKQSADSDAEEVLRRAARIDNFMTRNRLTPRALDDWMQLRRNLDELATAYGVSWTW
jgi:DNA repair exonuclease SbcCD ATPase subunit